MKFCKDCKHCLPRQNWFMRAYFGGRIDHYCKMFVAENGGQSYDRVTGEIKKRAKRYRACDMVRCHTGECGPDADLFESRQ